MACAHALAACSTTPRNSRERSESILRQLTSCRAILAHTEHVIGLHDLVDLARALVDHCPLAVAIEAADRIFTRGAVGAVNLNRVPRRALGCDGREPLRQTRFAGVAAALIFQRARAHPEQPRRL